MTKISLLEMGKTKKRNVREAILSVLSTEFPLSIKKIYNKVKKEHNLDVSYQAVFKIINGMLEDNVLEKLDKEYKLNIAWIKDLENELDMIKKSYMGYDNEKKEPLQDRVNSFIAEVAPKIKEYLGGDEACVVGVSGGGGIIFGVALFSYLLKEGVKASYIEYDRIKQEYQGKLIIPKKELENKKIIIVDSSIYTGKTHNTILERLSKVKKLFNIKGIKYAVEKDSIGLADFSREI